MSTVVDHAERALLAHQHPALRLSELLALAAEMDRTLDGRRLRSLLEDHPGRFRVLGAPSGAEASGADEWVVAVGRNGREAGRSDPAGRLYDSVRWLGVGVDHRSRSAVGRWHAIAIADRAARRVVSRAA